MSPHAPPPASARRRSPELAPTAVRAARTPLPTAVAAHRAARHLMEALEGRVFLSAAAAPARLAVGSGSGGDTTPPTVTLDAEQPEPTLGAPWYDVGVTFADDVAISAASLGYDDVVVTGPDGNPRPAAFVGSDVQDGPVVHATYRIGAPDGGFGLDDAGVYSLAMAPLDAANEASGVRDTSGNAVAPGPVGSFTLQYPDTGDTTAPAAMLEAVAPAQLGAPAFLFRVAYTDDVAVAAATIGYDDVKVTGPNGFDQYAFWTGNTIADGPNVEAEYSIGAPDGGLIPADAGTYTVSMRAFDRQSGVGGVIDTSGNGVPGGPIGSFDLAFPPPPQGPDDRPPVAFVENSNFGSPPVPIGATSYPFTIGYTDETAVSAASLGDDDLLVTGPGGSQQVAHYVGQATDGRFIRASYTLVAPAGGFVAADNGPYQVAVRPHDTSVGTGGVTDVAGNAVPADSIGFFPVFIGDASPSPSPTPSPTPPPTTPTGSDTQPPTASVLPNQKPGVLGSSSYLFVVQYNDNVAVDATTFGDDDVYVVSPQGARLPARFVGGGPKAPMTNATYAIDAPAGTFAAADAGKYVVFAQAPDPATGAGGVADNSGNHVAANAFGGFTLAFNAPTPSGALQLSGVGYAPGRYAPGGSIALKATIRNVGTAATGPLRLEFGLSTDPAFPEASIVFLSTMDFAAGLSPGQALPVRIPAAMIPAGAPAGLYFLGARVGAEDDDKSGLEDEFASAAADVAIAVPLPPPPVPPIGGADPNFGTNGIVRRQTGLTSTAAVAAMPDGRTVAVGLADGMGTHDFGVTRFNADGSLDTTFGGGTGVVFTDFGGNDDQAVGVRVQPDGKIVVAGTSMDAGGDGSNSLFVMARYNADGSLDASFGTGGRAVTHFAAPGARSADVAHDLVLLPDGRLLVSGRSDAAGRGDDFALARYNADGSPDNSFGTSGQVLADFTGGDDAANAIALDSRTGQILAAGSAADAAGAKTSFAVARFNADGSLDGSFGAGGKVTTSIGGQDDEAYAVAVNKKGQVYVAGGAFTNAGGATAGNVALARYTPKGVLDRAFGTGGIVTTSFSQPAVANQLQLQDDGGVLVAGATAASFDAIDLTHLDAALALFDANGAPSATFGTAGKTVLRLGTSTGTAAPVAAAAAGGPTVGAAVGSADSTGVPLVGSAASSASQQVLAILSKQRAIADALGGRVVVIGTSGTDTVAAQVVTSGADLSDAVTAKLPASVIGGAKGAAVVNITDAGNQAAAGTVTITLYASLDGNADSGDVTLATMSGKKVSLKAGASKAFAAKFVLPASMADGNYYILAKVDGGTSLTELSASNNTAATSTQVAVTAPNADLTGSPLVTPTGLTAGAKTALAVTIRNAGNVPAKGTINLKVLAAAAATSSDDDAVLASLSGVKVSLKAGASKTFNVTLAVPSTLTAGSYFLLAVIDGHLTAADPDSANDVLAGTDSLVVG